MTRRRDESKRLNRARFWAEVGWRLQLCRTMKKITQTELAAVVGVSRTSITNIESGKQRVLLEDIYLIAHALGVRVDKLMPDEGSVYEHASPLRRKKSNAR